MSRALIGILLLTGTLQAAQIDFDLLNNTGFGLDKVWLAKHSTGVWSLVAKEIPLGGEKHISLKNDIDWRLWDLKIEYRKVMDAGKARRRLELFTEAGFELPKIKRIVITVLSGDKWNAHYE